MDINSKLKNKLIVLYVLILALSALYVKSVITDEGVEISKQSDNEKKEPEVKEVTATLILDNGRTINQYKEKLNTTNSVLDLIDELRKQKILTYEKTEYTYGSEIDIVNGQTPVSTNKWSVIVDNTDITNAIADIKLIDGKTYTLSITKR